MAAAFRYLSKQGYDEGIAGHISLRDPENPHHFWINPLVKAFSTMKASDLVLVDEKGNILKGGNQAAINPAGFMIHSAIHKARPDVNAAVHTHSVYGKAFSALGIELDMISQDACESVISDSEDKILTDMQRQLLLPRPQCIPQLWRHGS